MFGKIFDKLKTGLTKTRDGLTDKINEALKLAITIDEDLMEAANIYAGEKVQVVDNTNGARIETYVIPGQRGSGCICINGAAAHLVHVGDTVIIMAYALMTPEEVKEFKPSIVFPNNNRV